MIRPARAFDLFSSVRLVLIDAAVIATVFYVAIGLTTDLDQIDFLTTEHGASRIAPLIAIFILSMYLCGLYDRKRVESRIYLLQQLSFCAGVGLISQALVSYIYDPWTLPRNLAMYGLVASIFVLFAWRLLRNATVSHLEGRGDVLILGTDLTGHRIARHIYSNPSMHLKVAGSLTDCPERGVAPVLGGISDLREVAGKLKPDIIVSGLADDRDRMPVADMVDLRFNGARIEEAGTACELICRCVSARDLRPSRLLFSGDFDSKDVALSIFLSDMAASILLLVAGFPFALIYAGLLRLSDGKPVLRREICAGFQDVPFTSLQLRVESKGALAAMGRGLHLRNWPQLWNVLRRRMSMVGPRPRRLPIANELSRLLPVDEYRRNTRPGITGWAEINLRRSGELDDAITEAEYDLYYVRNQSISLYTYILLHGVRTSI